MASVAFKFDNPISRPGRDIPQAATAAPSLVPAVTLALPGSEEHILSALSSDSLTNTIMSGFIRDNGFISSLNRGRFFVCRDEQNKLEGVALIGHRILFESFTDRATEVFAALARRESAAHLLMGEHNAVERFWHYYARENESPRHVCPILFMQRGLFEKQAEVPGLRLATPEDLDHVLRAQAAMAFETSGVDPLRKDPAGFRDRYLQRIERQRVWVLIENGRLLFKVDVMADTPQASYIEGVYVTPDQRGRGLGGRCLTVLGRALLNRTKRIYLFVENQNTRTRSFYLNLGFSVTGQYDLLYF